MLKMAAPMKQTWAVRNYLFSKRKHFKSLSICRRNVQESSWKNGNIGKVEIDIENGPIEISSGQFARFADGAAVAKQGDTTVMVTSISKAMKTSPGFMPLTVDYRQKAAAAGRIPTNYLRRELGPTEKEILISRLIDRSLRPLFPPWFDYETQIICNLMAVDGEHDPDILSINAASAALALSNIPWDGPVGAVRVGVIDDEIVINPTRLEQQHSALNLVLTGCAGKKIVMMEASADNVRINTFQAAIKSGISKVQNIITKIEELQKKHGKGKRKIEQPPSLSNKLNAAVSSLSRAKLTEIFQDSSHDKFSRDNEVKKVRSAVISQLHIRFPEYAEELFHQAFDSYAKKIFRSLVFSTNVRCDGRSLTQLRNISCQVDMFKPLHGSALFQRGQTQVMCTVTFDSLDSAARVDSVSQMVGGMKDKNFMLHYEFPPYATNEIARLGATSRREMGHGALAEKGLRSIIPDNFPFTIRLTSEVLESNGSSSMASICGGSLALMDAGVPISEPAAGVAMGLFVDENKPDSNTNYKILTDILGIEDYMGDMDFKIAGTKTGITALQVDVKLPGISAKIIQEALLQSLDAKHEILKIMKKTIAEPREGQKENGPVTDKLTISMVDRGKFLGIGGMNLKKLTNETGVRVTSIDECCFQLFAHNQQSMDEAREMIDIFLKEEKAPELEFGAVYTAKIVGVKEIGLMIQIHPKLEPILLHNMQLDIRKVSHPSALGFKLGDEISVKYYGRDPANGRIRVSRKVLQSTMPKIKDLLRDNTT